MTSTLTAAGSAAGLTRLDTSATRLEAPALAQLAAGAEWRDIDANLRAATKEDLPVVASRLLGVTPDPRRVAPGTTGRPASVRRNEPEADSPEAAAPEEAAPEATPRLRRRRGAAKAPRKRKNG